jgi:glycosyltransferase involved in cell wall biosynthesis
MRVLVPLHSFEPGGVERVALRLVRAWQADGIDAHLVMGRSDGAMRTEAEGLEIETIASGRIDTSWWETAWMIWHLPAIIRRTRPDVIFCAGNSYSIVMVAMKLWLGRRCPPVVAKISNDLARADLPAPARWGYRLWLRIQGRFIDHFTGMAPPMRAEIKNAIGASFDRVSIIDDPALSRADIARLAPHVEGEPQTHFLAIGRLAPQKNVPLLVRAFARIARGDDRLTILGEGGERARIEREIARLGMGARVRLAGHVADTGSWLRRAHVFALSSDYEGVPAVIAEALAAGLAIVATDCSVSMADMLGDGRFGTLVPVGDEDGLAHALDAARTAAPDRAAMAAQADRFTVERAAALYGGLFARLSHGTTATNTPAQ